MIIVKVWGGIGNQLFQYVFGQYLKYRYNQDVRYDDNSYISTDKLRKSELGALAGNIVYDNSCSFSKYQGVKNRLLRFAFQLNPKNHYIEEGMTVPNEYKPDHTYFFQGYWQDYSYYEWLVKNVPGFSISSDMIPDEVNEYFESIKSVEESVSIHVRRGDYFLPQNIKKYGVCDEAYFNTAVELLEKEQTPQKYFVFSDDLDWVMKNLQLPLEKTVFVQNYDVAQFLYIELMSLCRHHIISNSSFSWWGAVLNAKEGAYVVCPARWTLDSDKTIALSNWLKIKL